MQSQSESVTVAGNRSVRARRPRLRRFYPAGILFAGSLMAFSANVYAFQEDVCPDGAGGWQECIVNFCVAGDEAPYCSVSTESTTLSSVFLVPVFGPGARSTLHFDATYLMAQAVGFSPRDAYVVAAYDEATDTGKYVHRDQHGALAVDPKTCDPARTKPGCWLLTPTIGGVSRNDFTGGGLFFHFINPGQKVDGPDGLQPIVGDQKLEPFLFHLHHWLDDNTQLCVGGLYDSGGQSCFISKTRKPSALVGRLPFATQGGALTSIDFVADIGEQTIVTDPVTGLNTPASAMSQYISPEDLPLARLGIYLHALADRVSHHRCVDASHMEGPRAADAGPVLMNPAGLLLLQAGLNPSNASSFLQSIQSAQVTHDPDFVVQFDVNQCDQFNHFLRHSWETGYDRHQLSEENRTAWYGLGAVLDELVRYAAAHNMSAPQPLDDAARQALVNAILDATDVAGAQARIDALTALAEQRNWLPLPLYGGLSLEQWTARAGNAAFSKSATAQNQSGGGALDATSLMMFGFFTLLAMLRRQRQAQMAAFKRPLQHPEIRHD